MSSLKFYYPDGTEITDSNEKTAEELFIELYNHIYYFENRDVRLENRIQEILDSDSLDETDIIDILRWKIGATGFNYDELSVTNQWRTLYVKDLVDELKGTKMEVTDLDSVERIIELLMEYNGIGPVYAITLLYFISKGNYPIYDKFAHTALLMITDPKRKYNEIISDRERYGLFHDDATKMDVLVSDYNEYIKLLDAFSGEWKTSRNIDRALWAYGHLFNDIEKNKKRM